MPNSIIIDGVERVLGCLPREVTVGSICATLESRLPVIPRDQWKEVDWSYLHKIVIDQGNIGSCAGATTVGTIMGVREAAGADFIELSASSIYGQANGGRDQGATMSGVLQAARQVGATPVDVISHYAWRQRTWPSDWKERAKPFRILEFYDAPSFDMMSTGLQRGFLIAYGIAIGNSFRPNAQGIIPPPSGSGGGHAMVGCGLSKINNTWYIKTLNSWSAGWGLNGFCYVPEQYFRGNFVDGWAVRVVTSHLN